MGKIKRDTIKKNEFIGRMVEKGIKKTEATNALNITAQVIKECVEEGIEIPSTILGFSTSYSEVPQKEYFDPRKSRIPGTGIIKKRHEKVSIKLGKTLKDAGHKNL